MKWLGAEVASDPRVVGFNADEVRAGLLLAMRVGLPPQEADQPRFIMPALSPDAGEATDSAGVPLDWRGSRNYVGTDRGVAVPCAIEVFDRDGTPSGFGVMAPYRAVLTLLDEQYEAVKGFSYVLIGGSRYRYQHTEPPVGLVTIGVWTVHVVTDDEA